jgi:hypothetical protein
MTELEKQAEESLIILTTTKKAIELQDGIYLRLEEVKRLLFDNYIKGYQDANQWIDCKDKLPTPQDFKDECNDYYLVMPKNYRPFLAMFVRHRKGKSFWVKDYTSKVTCKITHWMPVASTDSINLK